MSLRGGFERMSVVLKQTQTAQQEVTVFMLHKLGPLRRLVSNLICS